MGVSAPRRLRSALGLLAKGGVALANTPNKVGMPPLAVAVSTGNANACRLLLATGAKPDGLLLDYLNVSADVSTAFSSFPASKQLATKYYFTYGSLKRGFPNHAGKKHEACAAQLEPNTMTIGANPLV